MRSLKARTTRKVEVMSYWINAVTSSKTTVGGLMLAVGTALLGAGQVGATLPNWALVLGLVLAAAGPVLLGSQARDADKSSQEHGVRPQISPMALRGGGSTKGSQYPPHMPLSTLLLCGLAAACFSGCVSLTPYSPGALSSNAVKVREETSTQYGVDKFEIDIKSRGDAAATTSVRYTGEAEAGATPWDFAVLGEANVESAERVKPINEGAGAALAALPDTIAPLVEALSVVGDAPEGTPGASIRDRIMQMIMDRVIGAVTGGGGLGAKPVTP